MADYLIAFRVNSKTRQFKISFIENTIGTGLACFPFSQICKYENDSRQGKVN
jgi:hypothetical protein